MKPLKHYYVPPLTMRQVDSGFPKKREDSSQENSDLEPKKTKQKSNHEKRDRNEYADDISQNAPKSKSDPANETTDKNRDQ